MKSLSLVTIPQDVLAEEEAFPTITFKIKTQSDYDLHTIILQSATLFCKKVKDFYDPHLKAAKAVVKGLTDDMKSHTDKVEAYREYARPLLGAFIQRKEAEAAAAAYKATLKAEAKAEAKGIDPSEVLPVLAKPVEKGTLSFRTTYIATIVDASLIPDEYWIVDESALNAVARETKGKGVIPGVKITEVRTPIERY